MVNSLAQDVLNNLPRLFSMMDMNCQSPTYGCLDRNYWHYKTQTDYPTATYQQSALVFAHLFASNFEGNDYYKCSEILGLAIAAINFWCDSQNKDGSFDEWFPNEHSFVATAFTLYGVTESILLLKNYINDKLMNRYYKCIDKAVRWLASKQDVMVINHTAGSLAAIYNAYLINNDKSYLKYINKKLLTLQKYQSDEGWFNEYDGGDPGYTTVSIDYIAKYYAKSKDERAFTLLESALNFVKYFVHPDGSFGGEYGNRNTKYIMPAGLHLLANTFDDAKYLLQKFYRAHENRTIPCLSTFDDRYFAFFFLPNFIESAVNFDKEDLSSCFDSLIEDPEGCETFEHAGFVVKKDLYKYFVCNFKKGGALKLFDNTDSLVYSDCSYFIHLENNDLVTTQLLNKDTNYSIDYSDDNVLKITLSTSFKLVNTNLPLTKILIPFRIFNYTFGKYDYFMQLFNDKLKKKLIKNTKKVPLNLKRTIILKNKSLKIEDKIEKTGIMPVKSVEIPHSRSALHVPSSKYFIQTDMRAARRLEAKYITELNLNNSTSVTTEIDISD